MTTLRLILVASLLSLLGAGCAHQSRTPREFTNWPAGTSPREVGLRVAESFAARPFEWQTNPKRKYVIYPEVCAWYGSLTLAQLTGSTDLQKRLLAKYDPLLTPEGQTKISTLGHVDYRIIGAVPLEFYRQKMGEQWRAVGLKFADAQWEKTTPDGITTEARYWIDDMYMSPILQMQAFRATGEGKYIERTALMMAAYLDKLQQPNGLFLHAPDSPFYWGRGNGWFAAGMAEVLRDLPKSNPHYARIMAGYRKMMAALLAMQDEKGYWKQLIDKPETWAESSCTAMFTYAMVTGVKHGWLDAKAYAPAARKAWLWLVSELDENAQLKDVCIGTNKSRQETKTDDMQVQYDFYVARKRETGNLHGQAPVLWTATALLR